MKWIRAWKAMVVSGLALAAAGCFEKTDILKINKDGSGTYLSRNVPGEQLKAIMAQADQRDNGRTNVELSGVAIPYRKANLERHLEGVDGVELIKYRETTDEKGRDMYEFAVSFESLSQLLNSPMGAVIGWCFKEENGQLVAYLPEKWVWTSDDDSNNGNLSDLQTFRMVKSAAAGVKLDRRIQLPNPVIEANTTRRSGEVLSWVFEINADTTREELTNPTLPRAVCSMEGITFDLPVTPAAYPQGGAADAGDDLPQPADDQAAGTVNGEEIAIRKADIRNGILSLYQNTDAFDGTSLVIFLFLDDDESPAGKTFKVPASAGQATPHVHMRYTVDGQIKTEMFVNKYQMTLQFGDPDDNGRLPGRIQLALPAEKEATLSGTFTAEMK